MFDPAAMAATVLMRDWMERACDAERLVVKLRAALNECHAALEPFAAEAECRPWVTDLSTASGLDEVNVGGTGLTNRDLRRAMNAHREAVE